MKLSVWVQMDTWVRHLVPFGTTLFLLLLTLIPLHVPAIIGIMPMLPMMCVYYWAIFRPDLFPAWAAFLIGLLSDVVAGTPLGVNALVLLVVQGVSASQRRFFLGKSFLVAWWAFGLLAAGAAGMTWVLTVMLVGKSIDGLPIMFQYMLTMGLFPILTRLLAKTQTTLLKDV